MKLVVVLYETLIRNANIEEYSLSALLDLHEFSLERLVLAKLPQAVSHHDAPPPGLDLHLVAKSKSRGASESFSGNNN